MLGDPVSSFFVCGQHAGVSSGCRFRVNSSERDWLCHFTKELFDLSCLPLTYAGLFARSELSYPQCHHVSLYSLQSSLISMCYPLDMILCYCQSELIVVA